MGPLLVALALIAAPGASRVAILPSVIKDADVLGDVDAQTVYDAAARALRFAEDLDAVSREELESSFSDSITYCGADLRCLCARLKSGDVDFAVELIVNQSIDPPELTAQLIDTTKQQSLAREVVTIDRDARATREAISSAVDRLLARTGRTPAGRVQVTVQPADALVAIDPSPRRTSEDGRTFALAPGTYRIRATREGFEDAIREVTVRAYEESRVELTLAESSSSVGPILLWGGIGAAVIGASIVAVVLLSSTEIQLCQGDPAECAR